MSTAHPKYGPPRSRDTSHLQAHGLEWLPLDDPEHGLGAYAHPPAGGCVAAHEDGYWLALRPGGKRAEGKAADEGDGRAAAIEALGAVKAQR
jgi:hypothetical protein